jgi:catechol 2,3-dioxygenase-like lactoylglutathione lyase family enzyme
MDIECERFHPSLQVTDVEAAARYYTDVLGFRRGGSFAEPVEWTMLHSFERVEPALGRKAPGIQHRASILR